MDYWNIAMGYCTNFKNLESARTKFEAYFNLVILFDHKISKYSKIVGE